MTPSPCTPREAYLDGSLSPKEVAAFEDHVATCEACLAPPFSDEERALLADLQAVTCPPDVLAAALAAVPAGRPDRAPRRHVARRRVRPVWAGVAFAAALAVLVATWSLRQDSQAPPPFADAGSQPVVPSVTAPPPAPPSPEPVVPEAAPPAPVQRGASRPRTTPARPSPTPAPIAQVVPQEPAPPDSVAAARDELLVAFAIVAEAQDQAARATTEALADGVAHAADAIRTLPPTLR